MQFLNPLVFFGLIALAIPVLIHLFNFRKPRRVFFTNVRFLKELKLQSKRKSKLKHLLVLLLRVLAFLSIVLAFAIPVIIKNHQPVKTGKPLIVVWVDNSFSMQSLGDKGVLLETAVRSASEVAGFYDPADEFFLITNDFSPKFSRIVNRSDFLDLITTVDFSPVSRNANDVFQRVDLMRKEYPNRTISLFIISDFQSSVVKIDEVEPNESVEIFLVPLTPIIGDNIFIDSAWLEIPVIRPGQITNFFVSVGNTAAKEVEDMPVTLSLNGREVAVATVTLPAKGKATVKLTTRIVGEGFYHGVVSVDDQPVTFDDHFYLGFGVSGVRRILSLHNGAESKEIKRLFAEDSLFFYQDVKATQMDFSRLNNFDIVYCHELKDVSSALVTALKEYVEGGGTLVLLPAMDAPEEQSANNICNMLGIAGFGRYDTADTRIASINFDHPLYKGVYSEKPVNLSMPMVYNHFDLQQKFSSGEEVVMKLINDRPLMLSSFAGKGVVYLLATSPDARHSGLASHAEIFVPPFYNMALFSGVVPPLYYLIGNDRSVSVSGDFVLDDNTLRVKSLFNETEFIPGHRAEPFGYLLFFEDQIREAGNYSVLMGESMVAPLAFNYDHKESDPAVTSITEMKEWISANGYTNVTILSTSGKKMDDKLRELNDGERMWRWFIIAALVFLLIEALLLRFWR